MTSTRHAIESELPISGHHAGNSSPGVFGVKIILLFSPLSNPRKRNLHPTHRLTALLMQEESHKAHKALRLGTKTRIFCLFSQTPDVLIRQRIYPAHLLPRGESETGPSRYHLAIEASLPSKSSFCVNFKVWVRQPINLAFSSGQVT